MTNQAVHHTAGPKVEGILRDELLREDSGASVVVPILRHLVSGQNNSLFSDEILARVRGMLGSLCSALLDELAQAATSAAGDRGDEEDAAALQASLMANSALMTHLHAIALEWQLTERFQHQLAIDPIVSPLVQTLISTEDADLRDIAMRFLGAQARWCQLQRRMDYPLEELSEEHLRTALAAMAALAQTHSLPPERVVVAETRIRDRYDEGATRLGLAARLILGLDAGVKAIHSLGEAGPALFLSALAYSSGQRRDALVSATHENQLARFALSLRAMGLYGTDLEREFQTFHPELLLPAGFEDISSETAKAMLHAGAREV